ncbi:hypothetical protein M8542_14355 [Amycolatopsis sp. OK19-0408]|uniref:Uncharacterized protein n=1 Tax=Amycolatopsis iheyensis TaxID=2945988 RepID=A0A9X2NAL2_9PSEU|nr:hypothetical protein [Amycolatopsis iheyensis]MCR6484003.1 hypothetical protein [Amycolatopsis iheyensis]
MTNEQLLDDLKQYVSTTVSQATADLKNELKDEMNKRFDSMDKRLDRMDERFDDIDGQLNEIQNAVGSELVKNDTAIHDLDKRVRRLEARAA